MYVGSRIGCGTMKFGGQVEEFHILYNIENFNRFNPREIGCGTQIKKYFDKLSKTAKFEVQKKVLLWDLTYIGKGKHTKFWRFWSGTYIVASVVGNNCYLQGRR